MWDLPGPGLEPMSPALAGGFLTTAPPGKPQTSFFFIPLALFYFPPTTLSISLFLEQVKPTPTSTHPDLLVPLPGILFLEAFRPQVKHHVQKGLFGSPGLQLLVTWNPKPLLLS